MNSEDAVEAIRFLQNIKTIVRKSIVGQDDVIDGMIVALFTGGHVLLESNPGLGKTSLAKSFADCLNLEEEGEARKKFGRIQFTPDLLPSDITGTLMPKTLPSGEMTFGEFIEGPIFREILLADEINRATPKTQAAMLEAMAEGQVTVLGQARPLVRDHTVAPFGRQETVRNPFMVIATQNPIDQEGTYDLPEAQADRFQLKLLMRAPDSESLIKIVDREALGGKERRSVPRVAAHSPGSSGGGDLNETRVASTRDESLFRIDRIRRMIVQEPVPESLVAHATNIVQSTNGLDYLEQTIALSEPVRRELAAFVDRFIDIPLGPRTAIALVLAVKAHALLSTDISAALHWQGNLPASFTAMAPAVLRHRLKLKPEWEEVALSEYGASQRSVSVEKLRDRVIGHLVSLAAPQIEEYGRYFRAVSRR